MIQSLSNKYNKQIASALLTIFYLQIISPLHAAVNNFSAVTSNYLRSTNSIGTTSNTMLVKPATDEMQLINNLRGANKSVKTSLALNGLSRTDIGGPGSPEASSFKSAGTNDLVNLFTGDFSYSVPLLDVGGYPVNLFYSGGITMEQEASWVGLGWNINPGSVSRTMRGIPDDFNGTDMLTQKQDIKPNRTWGGEVNFDSELIGIKKPKSLTLSVGYSYNNYLGPAMELGAGLSISLLEAVKTEKTASTDQGQTEAKSDTASTPASPGGNGVGNLGLGLNMKLGSRSGFTFSPSLNAAIPLLDNKLNIGTGLSTSYNSRTGLSSLYLSSQLSFTENKYKDSKKGDPNVSIGIGSTSFEFAKPSYMPTLRMPMQNDNSSGRVEFGSGAFGSRFAGTLSGYYQESKIPNELKTIQKPLVGFIYSEKAANNKNAVMDFNRLGDAEVTPNTPIISAPQYTYDIFNIQGEGTGGSIRAYRSDLGFMRDNVTQSRDKSLAMGVDIAPPGHYGLNINKVKTPTTVGGWDDMNNTLTNTLIFRGKQVNANSFENVYFKNPGEATVTNDKIIDRIGGDDLVRFKLDRSNKTSVRLESGLERFYKKDINVTKDNLTVATNTTLSERDKRTQVTTMLTAEDAVNIGLEPTIRNYTGAFADNGTINSNGHTIYYNNIDRIGGIRKGHHISEIDVLEQNGMRYIYGVPVYNVIQKEFTFSVGNTPSNASDNIVSYEESEANINTSAYMNNKSKIDGYVMSQETPAYATAFLLNGLLSPDYVDVTGNGITEDDLGNAVKFNYNKSNDLHKWRTPRGGSIQKQAHFNEGLRTEKKDNKAIITYGEREVWYLNSIESKSMVAIFRTDTCSDRKGVIGDMNATVNPNENANKKLTRIDLYTKSEIKNKGIANAIPIKSVNFEYDYSLCDGTPDNANGAGKLTLKSVYFTYNGQNRLSKDRYVFNYGNINDNPSYELNASDRWGIYKPSSSNPAGLTNADYPYTLDTDKIKNDQYAAAWTLKKILLPTGGQIEVEYEADDYGYVQNRRACNMFSIAGLGRTKQYSNDSSLYNMGFAGFFGNIGVGGLLNDIIMGGKLDNYYVYVKLPKHLENTDPAKARKEIYDTYLEGITQLSFKLQVLMPKGWEPLTVYSEYLDYGLCTNTDYMYIQLKPRDGRSPLAKSTIGFLTGNIPGQAFKGYETEVDNLLDFFDLMGTALEQITTAFKNVDVQMREKGKARMITLEKSFVRLNNGDRKKYGGGARVKRVLMKNNWKKMTNQYDAVLGQDYDYTTTEKVNGKDIIISSGVAAYEPSIGSEENPFREIVSFSNKMPLASAEYGALEMPMLDAFYPSPGVGYSKITVRSIHRKGTHGDSTVRSAIGKQVTEYYTAKEYPTYSVNTTLDDVSYNKKPYLSFFRKNIINRRTLSQGFLVETNDMHGKIKRQAAYSENDETTPLSYSYHTYKNTGKNGLNDKVDFVFNEQGGVVKKGNIGIDMELMTDAREFKILSDGVDRQIQLDMFTLFPLPTYWPLRTIQENLYRAVTCTKLINYHAIEDTVFVMDKGSVVSTQTIAYDAETGSPIVMKTANEFNDPIYNVSYPAYWAYSGVAPAYKNINREFAGVNFYDGRITNAVELGINLNAFESGDELYITNNGSGTSGCISQSGNVSKLWAFDTTKSYTSLNQSNKYFVFMDKQGNLFTKSGVSFRIVRSGQRNNLGLSVSSATMMKNPIQNISGVNKLLVNGECNVVSVSAIEHKEKWAVDCLGSSNNPINPYQRGLLGNFKPYRSYTYYAVRNEIDVANNTAIRKNGYLKDFSNYWSFNTEGNLIPDISNTKWVWNSELMATNVKGQELETKDALNRYSSAQYGFNKNLVTAMVQNAPNDEMIYEGFEDYGYTESINGGDICSNGTMFNPQHVVDFNNDANVYGVSYTVVDNGNGTQTITVHYQSMPQGTNAVAIAWSTNGYEWNSYTTNAASPRSHTLPIGNYSYQFRFLGSNSVTVNLDPVSLAIKPSAHSGNKMLVVMPSSTRGFTAYATNSNYPRTSDSIRFSINPDSSVVNQTYFTNPTNAGVNGTSTNSSPYFDPTYFIASATDQVALDTISMNGFCQISSFHLKFTLRLPNEFLGCGTYGSINSLTLKISSPDNVIFQSSNFTTSTYYDISGNKFLLGEIYSGSLPNALYKVEVGVNFAKECTNPLYYSLSGGVNSFKNSTIVTNQLSKCLFTSPIQYSTPMLNPSSKIIPNKRMQFSAWVQEECNQPCTKLTYADNKVKITYGGSSDIVELIPSGPIIDGWQKIEGEFTPPIGAYSTSLNFMNNSGGLLYVDDIRIHPYNANMKSYAYDPRTLRLSAELDENNYATFYEYDEEGQLVRTKKETIQGIKTIQETRIAKQRVVTEIQP